MQIRTLGAATTALLALTVTAPAGAADGVASELYGAAARARAAAISVQGEQVTFASGVVGSELDAVRGLNDVTAAGMGADVSPETAVVATNSGQSQDGCAVPQLGALPVVVEAVCGAARITGTGADFSAVGTGRVGTVSVVGDDIVDALLGVLFDRPELAPILGEQLGVLAGLEEDVEDEAEGAADEVDAAVASAVSTLNRQLRTLVGQDLSGLAPALDVSDTLGDLLDRLTATPLATLRLGEARSEVTGTAATLTSRAVDDGATIELLPGLLADGSPLARVTVSASMAEVVYDRAGTASRGTSRTAEVRVESPLLSISRTVEPGQSLSIFCEGDAVAVPGLCTEVSVGTPSEREVDGRLQVESALVTLHVAKGLELPGLGGVVAQLPVDAGEVLRAVNGVLDTLNLSPVGVATAAGGGGSGVRIELAGTAARGGGAKVLAAAPSEEPPGALPRTGAGSALPYAASALLGAGAGLRTLVTRRRRYAQAREVA